MAVKQFAMIDAPSPCGAEARVATWDCRAARDRWRIAARRGSEPSVSARKADAVFAIVVRYRRRSGWPGRRKGR